MMKDGLIAELQTTRQFFLNSTSCLQEEDSTYAPKKEMFSVAQHVAHVGKTVDWFIDGAFGTEGFNLNFDQLTAETKTQKSLKQALESFEQAINRAVQTIRDVSESELMTPLPDGPIMAGVPKMAVIGAISEHTAHHRGALTVYSRLLGKVPQMPYADA